MKLEVSVHEDNVIVDTAAYDYYRDSNLSIFLEALTALSLISPIPLSNSNRRATRPTTEKSLALASLKQHFLYSTSTVIQNMNSPVFGSVQNEYSLDKLEDKTLVDPYNQGAIVLYKK